MIYTYRKTITSVSSPTVVSSETYSDLGVDLNGNDLSLVDVSSIPRIKVENGSNRRLRATDITILGFNIEGDNIGDDPPYETQILIKIE